MNQEQPLNETIPTAETVVQNQRRHWFHSTPWWTITSLLFCVTFIGLGINAISVYWSDPTEESVWDFLTGLSGLLGAVTGMCALGSSTLRRFGYGKHIKSPSRSRLASRILGACFVFAMVGIMIPMFHGATLSVNEASERQKAEDALSAPWNLRQFSGGQFAFQIPSNWKLQSEGESGLQMNDDANGIMLAVSATPKVDLAIKSLNEFHDLTLKNFNLNGAEVNNSKRSEIGCQVDRQLQDMMVIYHTQAENTQSFIRHIDFPDHWVSIYFQFRPSKLERNIDTMLRIADSVWLSPSNDYVLQRFTGTFLQSGKNTSYPMRLFILAKDETGEFKGVMNWPSLDYAATRFNGTMNGGQFSLTENEVLVGAHRVVVPVEHEGTLQRSSMKGEAIYKSTISSYELELVATEN